MYADFSTLKLHINETELDTLKKTLKILDEISEYLEEEDTIDITLDFGEDDEMHISTFEEKYLNSAIEALEIMLME